MVHTNNGLVLKKETWERNNATVMDTDLNSDEINDMLVAWNRISNALKDQGLIFFKK